MFYLTTHSTHFIYGYMASDIWLRTILIVRKETRCRHIGYSYRLTARVLLYAPSHRQDNTYHGLCYTSRGALAGTRNSSMGPPHEGANALPLKFVKDTTLQCIQYGYFHRIPAKSASLCIIRYGNSINLVFVIVEGRKEMFYLMTHSTHFIVRYMASDIW